MLRFLQKLKDMFSATKTIKDLRSQLELSEMALDDERVYVTQLRDERDLLEYRLFDVKDEVEKLTCKIEKTEARNNGLKMLMLELADGDAVDFEELYNTLRPDLDLEGWNLLRAAESVLGKFSYSDFPYEDNTGVFDRESCDGHELVGWLEGKHFDAFDYEPIVGACCERAHYVGHDKSAPEYISYREDLFMLAVENMLGIKLPGTVLTCSIQRHSD